MAVLVAGAWAVWAAGQTPATPDWTERRLTLPMVGSGTAYIPKAEASQVVLFLSGDGGWNLGVVDMARRIAPHAIVIGISYPSLQKAAGAGASCWYPAGDLEVISRAAQKQLGLAEYRPPILVGYSSGASAVYTALAGAPPTTFAGGVSLGFCPELTAWRPVCSAGGWRPTYDERRHISRLPATRALAKDWYILQGLQDQVCPFDATKAFLIDVPRAELIPIEGTGHGFARTARWAPSFDRAIDALVRSAEPAPAPRPPEVPAMAELERGLDALGLPLIYRWAAAARAFIIFVSGDGGWASIDEGIAQVLTGRGIGVVGLNALRYFWSRKDAAAVGAALGRVSAVVGGHGVPIFAGGYSFGAGVLPAAIARWPAADRDALAGLVLISPGVSAEFEISPLDWIRTAPPDPNTRVAPVLRLLARPTLCLAGTEETGGACFESSAAPGVQVVRLPGSHHYRGDYAKVGAAVGDFIDQQLAKRRTPVATRGRN
jgi:type IV secretory pathway VirJ component